MASKLISEWVVDYACHQRMTSVIHVFTYDEMKQLALEHLLDDPSGISSASTRFMILMADTIMTQNDQAEFEVAFQLIEALFAATGKSIPFKIYAKSVTGLKILVLFEMLRAGRKDVMLRFNEYFPEAGYNHPLAPEKTKKSMTEAQHMFRNFFIPLVDDAERRKNYFENSMKDDFGPKFYTALIKQIQNFLKTVENMLPTPMISKLMSQAGILAKLAGHTNPLISEFGNMILGSMVRSKGSGLSEQDILTMVDHIKSYNIQYRRRSSEEAQDSSFDHFLKPTPDSQPLYSHQPMAHSDNYDAEEEYALDDISDSFEVKALASSQLRTDAGSSDRKRKEISPMPPPLNQQQIAQPSKMARTQSPTNVAAPLESIPSEDEIFAPTPPRLNVKRAGSFTSSMARKPSFQNQIPPIVNTLPPQNFLSIPTGPIQHTAINSQATSPGSTQPFYSMETNSSLNSTLVSDEEFHTPTASPSEVVGAALRVGLEEEPMSLGSNTPIGQLDPSEENTKCALSSPLNGTRPCFVLLKPSPLAARYGQDMLKIYM